MGKLAITTVVVFIILTLTVGYSVKAEEYRISPGDVLSIGVYGYEELQVKALVVRPDGLIAFPLVGEVKAAGMTAADFTNSLTERLVEFVKSPQVTVNVDKFHTTRVYVLGEVTKPGLYEIEKQHNLLDAIGAAGGYTQRAAKKKVFVIKKDKPDHPVAINLLNLLRRGDLSQNIPLADGDVVYLGSNHKIVFTRDILPFISAAAQISDINDD